LHVERRVGEDDTLLIRVEDDGGGDAARVERSTGFGLTGIRERVTAAGGSLSILPANRGLSIAATIPLAA
jgi:signal transduction histidine kinase